MEKTMKIKAIVLGLLILACLGSCDQAKKTSEMLWYRQPANNWFEALPLGNGRLGAMVFGDISREHLQLNEESLWAGCPEDPYPKNVEIHYPKFQQLNLEGRFQEAYDYAIKHLVARPTSFRSYQPLGDLFIKFDQGDADQYKRALDLSAAKVTIEYAIDGKRFRREAFVSGEDDVLVYRVESLDQIPLNCEIVFSRDKDVSIERDEDEIRVEGQIFDDPEGYDDNGGGSGEGGMHMRFAALVKVKVENGEVRSTDSSLVVKDSESFTVILGAATNYNIDLLNFDEQRDCAKVVRETVTQAAGMSYKSLQERQALQHSAAYDRVALEINGIAKDTIPTDQRLARARAGYEDPYLALLLFQYGRYLLLASSGEQAALPANLQGIWNQDMWAAWESDYHLNINLQMNYWPAEVCNLSETIDPLSQYLQLLTNRGRATAKKFIGSEGWVLHHVSNPFGRTTPSGSNVNSQITNGYSFPLAGAWMAMTLWRHYEFTKDEDYLEMTAYPILKGAARFILDFLQEDQNGQLVTAPSYSPENTYIDPVSGSRLRNTVAATIDIQIIKDVFQACLQSETLLGLTELSGEIETALVRLPDIKVGANGTIQEWIEDYEEAEPGHRHISHLYGLHPSNQINPGTPELLEAARKTLERRLSYGGGQTGWSRAWMVNFYARLQDGNTCLHHVNELLKKQITPNLFDLHPPHIFQIDGNLGVAAGIAEMLVQSHEPGTIRLLPALPDAWMDGRVSGLKARGNFELDMHWEHGSLIRADILSIKGGRTKVVFGDIEFDLDLAPGETERLAFKN
jgi:alpha-L-fucosidase 2